MADNRYILNFTPTGMIPTKKMTHHVPITPDEIIEDVLRAATLGITIAHLHARDPATGKPTYEKDIYGEIIKGIRKENKDLILGVSTSGRTHNFFDKRSECLELDGHLKPDLASLTLSSLNFNHQASINTPDMIKDLAKKMQDRGIRPELEVFDLGMINYAKYLIRKGLLSPPYYFNIILGNIACAQADILHLGLMINELPKESIWSVGGVGDPQLRMNLMSLVSGGGVRVGIEDNIWFDEERTQLSTNFNLVKRIVSIAETIGKRSYSPMEARDLLQLKNDNNIHSFIKQTGTHG